jgi:hypothetical protein
MNIRARHSPMCGIGQFLGVHGLTVPLGCLSAASAFAIHLAREGRLAWVSAQPGATLQRLQEEIGKRLGQSFPERKNIK